MSIKWYGDKFNDRLEAQLQDGITDATEFYAGKVREKISTPGPPRSEPGQPPHVDTGDLLASIEERVDRPGLVGQVSSDEPQSVYMELGTVNVAARPAWVPALTEHADEIARKICGK